MHFNWEVLPRPRGRILWYSIATGEKNDNPDMARFDYNDNTIRIQGDLHFTSGIMQGKENKRNSWIDISYETVPKPKIRKWIRWLPKYSRSFVPPLISEQWGGGETSKKWARKQLFFKKKQQGSKKRRREKIRKSWGERDHFLIQLSLHSSLGNPFLKLVASGTFKNWSCHTNVLLFFLKFRLSLVCEYLN